MGVQLANPVSRQSRPPGCGESGLDDLTVVRPRPSSPPRLTGAAWEAQESSSESNPRGGVSFFLYTDNAPLTNLVMFYMGNEELKL